jgi:hypothetical protein
MQKWDILIVHVILYKRQWGGKLLILLATSSRNAPKLTGKIRIRLQN